MKAVLAGSGALIALWVGVLVGWIANIVQILPLMHEPLTTYLVVKLLGVPFAPLGAVLGWVGMLT